MSKQLFWKNLKFKKSDAMCSVGSIENITMSSKYTKVNCHLTADDMKSIVR